jgi:DNA-binding MarR family transcriptional regulator
MGNNGFSSFLSNHGHVLVCVARDPDIRLRELAEQIGITERAANKIVSELVAEGYIERIRVGRRNHYRVRRELPMRHRLHRKHEVGDLLGALTS